MAAERKLCRPSDDQVKIMCDALLARFGDRAVAIVERQIAAASGDAATTWARLLARLEA